jgi:prolyl oligopeptidase
MAAWAERGGLLAVANLRGGGEYGRAWHEAGRRANKQNVFDDFCACALWLATSGWSRRDRIAIMGSSNGGLLVGACLTQHPELFGACVPHVGVFDMPRSNSCPSAVQWEHGAWIPARRPAAAGGRAPVRRARPGHRRPALSRRTTSSVRAPRQ